MEQVFKKPHALCDVTLHYCPGCTHGIVHRLVAEVMDELGIEGSTIGVAPVGCAVFAYDYFNCDMQEAAHGRAPAVATGIKRTHPTQAVFTYQGDGDLGAIGFSEIMHAANRGEKIFTVFINNSTYGMTGGQMAPTTLIGQKTTTTPFGRNPENEGYPMKMCELISQLEAPVYVARFSLDTPANVLKAKAGLRKAFEINIKNQGFAFVELLCTCPTNWGMSAQKCIEWMKENTMKTFPTGVFKMKDEVK